MGITTIGGASSGSGLQPQEQIFTTSGTWTKPTGVKQVECILIGASGGANNGSTGAGGFFRSMIDVSSLSSLSMTIGAGGGAGGQGGFSLVRDNTGTVRLAAAGSLGINTANNSTPLGAALDLTQKTWASNAIEVAGTAALPSSQTWAFIRRANGKLFAFASSAAVVAVSSDEGFTWVQRSLPAIAGFSSYASEVVYGNGTYVYYYYGSATIFTSTDTITWTSRTLNNTIQAMDYGPAGFIAHTSVATVVAKSADGVTWTYPTKTGTNSDGINGIGNNIRYCPNLGKYITQGMFSTYLSGSSDGVAWSYQIGNTNTNFINGASINYNSQTSAYDGWFHLITQEYSTWNWYRYTGTWTYPSGSQPTTTQHSATPFFINDRLIFPWSAGGTRVYTGWTWTTPITNSSYMNTSTLAYGELALMNTTDFIRVNSSVTNSTVYRYEYVTQPTSTETLPNVIRGSSGLGGPGSVVVYSTAPSIYATVGGPGYGEYGWGAGTMGWRRTPGSGVYGTPGASNAGNSGIVIIRWWA